MSLNTGALNSNALNAPESGVYIVGEGQLISFEQILETVGSGLIISIESSTGPFASGQLISFEQIVREYMTGEGSLIEFEQDVNVTLSGQIIGFEQRTFNDVPDRISRCGWNATLTINGNSVPLDQIGGDVDISRAEGQASLMTVTLIPSSGFQNLTYFLGKSIKLDVHTVDGTFRVYTGVIDIPEVDITNKKITLRCTDKRTEQINAQLGNVVKNIGYFSPLIFQDVRDVADELEKRLSTIPQTVDFDPFGNYTLTSLFAKNTADFVLNDNEVYYRDPSVQIASRGRIINKVSIGFQYRYERLHHVRRDWTWQSPISTDVMLLLRNGYSMTFRSMVQGAIDSAGWPIQGEVTYTPIWPSGWYGGIAWSTVRLSGSTSGVTDSSGNPVLDSGGNQVMTTRITGGTDYGPIYCMGASWSATTRFTQTITETRTFTVTAPQSIAQFGNIDTTESYSTEDSFDSSVWEKYDVYSDLGLGETNYSILQDANRNQTNAAIVTVLNKAKTSILKSHRDSRASISKFLWPQIDLKHTVELDTTTLQAKGKVVNINHKLNVSSGEAVTSVSIALFQSTGSASNSALIAPSAIVDSVTYPDGLITLGNHFGQDPTQPDAANWTGMVGNIALSGVRTAGSSDDVTATIITRSGFSEQFIVNTPAIPDNIRNAKSLYASHSYTVSIPNDDLIVIF